MWKQVLSALALVVLALACAGEASALVQRTFVSGLGSDANDCSRAAPCRTFGAAIAQTLAGGEVLALDTAGYGPVTIDKAISLISPPGVYAGITTTVANATAISVNAGANDVVVLKGLSLSGLGLGYDGVQFTSGKALRVEGLTISGFTNNGISFSVAETSQLTVSDSLIRDNDNYGIETFASAGEVRATINRTTLAGNYRGLLVSQGGRATVRDSVASGNAVYGFAALGAGTVLTIENCLSSGNTYGIYSGAALVRVAGSTVVQNTSHGLLVDSGGSILSRGNNTVEGNATSEVFTGSFAPK